MMGDGNNLDAQKIYEVAIDHYGHSHQIIKAMEECAELIQALAKYLPQKEAGNKFQLPPCRERVIDEIADVMVMTDQLLLMFDRQAVLNRVQFKRERLAYHLGMRNYVDDPVDEGMYSETDEGGGVPC